METDLLYHRDAYLRQFDAIVVDVDKDKNAILLNRTAFFPGGGGQPADDGSLSFTGNSCKLEGVKRENGKIWHIIQGGLPSAGESVSGEIDWGKRYRLMRTHTAMHILCGVIWRDYQAQVTGSNMEPLSGRMDFEFENMNANLVREIEEKINLEVDAEREIEVKILPREEANKIPDLIRTRINLLPAGLREIRIVHIIGLDLQADGGTHVGNTKEVGTIRITDYQSKGRINKRIKIRID